MKFYIAFDGFDLFQLHFETREAAQKHLDDNFSELVRHCDYSVAVYEKECVDRLLKDLSK